MKKIIIALEGIDGAGKSTIINFLVNILKSDVAVYARTRKSGLIDKVVSCKFMRKHYMFQVPIYIFLSHINLFRSRFDLKKNNILIMDRCFLSNICYFFPKSLNDQKLFKILMFFEPKFLPQKIFVLDVAPSIAQKRDIFKKDLEWLVNTRTAYLNSQYSKNLSHYDIEVLSEKDLLISSEKQLESKDGDGIYIYIQGNKGTFNKELQIGNDSIDLQIGDEAYIMNSDYKYINTLSEESFEKFFEKVSLSLEKGYDLKPGEILFVSTLERIQLIGDLTGRVTGRSVFARMGLAVHCTQDKFSSGINSVVGLQLINHSNNVLKIFPYQKLAQMIIHKTSPMEVPYTGSFSRESLFTLPLVTPKDLSQYSERDKSLIAQHVPKKKNMFQRKKRTPELNSLFQGIISVGVSQQMGW